MLPASGGSGGGFGATVSSVGFVPEALTKLLNGTFLMFMAFEKRSFRAAGATFRVAPPSNNPPANNGLPPAPGLTITRKLDEAKEAAVSAFETGNASILESRPPRAQGFLPPQNC
jgi:hypothetical protein